MSLVTSNSKCKPFIKSGLKLNKSLDLQTRSPNNKCIQDSTLNFNNAFCDLSLNSKYQPSSVTENDESVVSPDSSNHIPAASRLLLIGENADSYKVPSDSHYIIADTYTCTDNATLYQHEPQHNNKITPSDKDIEDISSIHRSVNSFKGNLAKEGQSCGDKSSVLPSKVRDSPRNKSAKTDQTIQSASHKNNLNKRARTSDGKSSVEISPTHCALSSPAKKNSPVSKTNASSKANSAPTDASVRNYVPAKSDANGTKNCNNLNSKSNMTSSGQMVKALNSKNYKESNSLSSSNGEIIGENYTEVPSSAGLASLYQTDSSRKGSSDSITTLSFMPSIHLPSTSPTFDRASPPFTTSKHRCVSNYISPDNSSLTTKDNSCIDNHTSGTINDVKVCSPISSVTQNNNNNKLKSTGKAVLPTSQTKATRAAQRSQPKQSTQDINQCQDSSDSKCCNNSIDLSFSAYTKEDASVSQRERSSETGIAINSSARPSSIGVATTDPTRGRNNKHATNLHNSKKVSVGTIIFHCCNIHIILLYTGILRFNLFVKNIIICYVINCLIIPRQLETRTSNKDLIKEVANHLQKSLNNNHHTNGIVNRDYDTTPFINDDAQLSFGDVNISSLEQELNDEGSVLYSQREEYKEYNVSRSGSRTYQQNHRPVNGVISFMDIEFDSSVCDGVSLVPNNKEFETTKSSSSQHVDGCSSVECCDPYLTSDYTATDISKTNGRIEVCARNFANSAVEIIPHSSDIKFYNQPNAKIFVCQSNINSEPHLNNDYEEANPPVRLHVTSPAMQSSSILANETKPIVTIYRNQASNVTSALPSKINNGNSRNAASNDTDAKKRDTHTKRFVSDDACAPVSSSDVRTISSDVRTLPSDVRTLPSDVRTIPSDVRTLPSDVRTLPSDVRTLPSDVRTLPSDVRTLPSDVRTLPFEVRTLPSDVRSLPYGVAAASGSVCLFQTPPPVLQTINPDFVTSANNIDGNVTVPLLPAYFTTPPPSHHLLPPPPPPKPDRTSDSIASVSQPVIQDACTNTLPCTSTVTTLTTKFGNSAPYSKNNNNSTTVVASTNSSHNLHHQQQLSGAPLISSRAQYQQYGPLPQFSGGMMNQHGAAVQHFMRGSREHNMHKVSRVPLVITAEPKKMSDLTISLFHSI